MLKLVLFALTLTLAAATTDSKWRIYKTAYNKKYSPEEEPLRRYVWESNLNKIEAHNELYAKGISSYYQGENDYTDMPDEEIKRKMKGLILPGPVPEKTYEVFGSGRYEGILPNTIDWRQKGYVTPVKNQKMCGSCWAFSSTGSLEGQHFKKTGRLVSLSESNLIDCSWKFGDQGCNGGWMMWAFNYVIANEGIDTEASYPYVAVQRPCAFQSSTVGATAMSYSNVTHGSEDALQMATATVGPISVAIDATGPFGRYKGGVYDNPNCSTVLLDHAVLVVGYGTENGKDFWLVKNSWGGQWGDYGYIKMSRNKRNQCGIASMACYPNM